MKQDSQYCLDATAAENNEEEGYYEEGYEEGAEEFQEELEALQ